MTRKVRGVGINNVKGVSTTNMYFTWVDMITRCYNNKGRRLHHWNYVDCTVCDEWLLLSNFKEWYEFNYVDGFCLDKDVLGETGKVYSPDFCVYVPQEINKLFNTRSVSRGGCPVGVTHNMERKNYRSQINMNGRTVSIGIFDNPKDAHLAYVPVRNKYLHSKLKEHVTLGNISNEYAELAYKKFKIVINS